MLGFRKGDNGRGCEEPTRWKANRAPKQTPIEKFPVAGRPKNLRMVVSNIRVNVAVCTVQHLYSLVFSQPSVRTFYTQET